MARVSARHLPVCNRKNGAACGCVSERELGSRAGPRHHALITGHAKRGATLADENVQRLNVVSRCKRRSARISWGISALRKDSFRIQSFFAKLG
jgi:hypothetical protein